MLNLQTRKTLLNISFPLMALFLLLTCLVLRYNMHSSWSVALSFTLLYLFTAVGFFRSHDEASVTCFQAYSIGEGPMAFLISAESFPMVNREIGMSIAVCQPSCFLPKTNWTLGDVQLRGSRYAFGLCTHAGESNQVLGLISHVWVILSHSMITYRSDWHRVLNLVCWIACYFLVPQTQGRSIDDIFRQRKVASNLKCNSLTKK